MAFTAGDKAIVLNGSSNNCGSAVGHEVTLLVPYTGSRGVAWYTDCGKGTKCCYVYEKDLEAITDPSSMSSLTERFVNIFLTEPEKTFRKAGITDSKGMLTGEGQALFLSWLLKKEGEDFKKEVVDPIVAEEKE